MTAPQTGRIFISYRRADSAGYAGRIYDRLSAHFGKESIFMDVDTIPAGLDFVEVLENAVQSCDVLVALIGRQWLSIKDEAGKRRLDNPQDFVRIEVAAALGRSIRVIPVLVDGVPMPNSDQLPHGLKTLARRNAVLVNHHSFHNDANSLIEQLELALKAAEESKIRKAKELKEKEAQKKRQVEIENLLSQADIALDSQEFELAKEKLEAVFILEPEHVQAQVKLAIVERKLRETIEQNLAEDKAKQEAAQKAEQERKERERLEREEKARKGKDAADKAAREKAEREAAEKAARDKTELEAAEKTAREKAEREAAEKAASEKDEREAAEMSEREAKEIREENPFPSTKQNLKRYGIASSLVLAGLIGLIIGGTYIFRNLPISLEPTPTEQIITPTKTRMVTRTPKTHQTTPTPSSTLTPKSPTVTPTFSIGSTMISEKDGMVQVFVKDGANVFWIDKTEVTNYMYKMCVRDNICFNKPSTLENPFIPSYYENNEFDHYPVVFTNQLDAQTYCTWAGRRLPTADEWELAATGSGYKTYDGGGINYYIVGTFDVSEFGVNDMGGDIDEWTNNGLMISNRGIEDTYPVDGQNFATGFRCASNFP